MLNFADEATITVTSGNGGNGCVAFRREKYIPKGGPAGGDGGCGGDIIFQIKPNMRTLVQLRYKRHFKAKNGQDGMGKQMHGKDGESCTVFLPPGCTIKNAETGEIIHDFGVAETGSFTFLKGGKGGWGNIHFKTSTNQAPRTARKGQEGKSVKLLVELSIIADLGLVGFPNAGKSSILDYYTNARPKIAPYPFTTKIPNLGVLRVDRERDIIIADIPGIMEGASSGYGLGVRFLKHISRTSGLVFLIDLCSENFLEAYFILRNELEAYSESLVERPRLIVGSKLDLPGAKENLAKLKEALPDEKVFGVSVFNKWGLAELKKAMIELVEGQQKLLEQDNKKSKAETIGFPKVFGSSSSEKNFMENDIGEDYFDKRLTQESDAGYFGATVSLSKKRKPEK